MINLLPPLEKKNLEREEKYRLVLILGILVLLFLFSLSLILFAVKIYISGQVESQKILIKDLQTQEFEEEIKLINKDLSKLSSFYESQISWTKTLERFSRTIPEGIYLTSFSLSLPEVRVSGFCPSRDTLFNFKKRLEKEPDFKEIYFPSSNWAKPKDIDFNLNFKINL